MMILKMAWRNIWRNKRRTLITMLAIVFATYLTVLMRGMQTGVYQNSIKGAVEMTSGYLQIQDSAYKDKPSLRNSFKINLELLDVLQSNEKIKGYSPRIEANGLIGYNQNSLGSMILGINPDLERNVTKLHSRLDEGEFISSDKVDHIVVGSKLLDNLNTEIGDTVVILANTYEGYMGNMKYIISGTIKTGSAEMDKRTILMNIKAVNELLSMHNRITSLALSLQSLDDIEPVKAELENIVSKSGLRVLDWGELMPEFKQSIELDEAGGIIYLLLLILIVGFGIMNTITMSVNERYKEFGVMLALGAKHFIIVMTLFLEVILMTILGVIIGNIIGYFTNLYYVNNPYKFTGEILELYREFGFDPVMTSSVNPEIFISTSLTVIIVAVIVYLLSAFKIFKLEALKGMRHT